MTSTLNQITEVKKILSTARSFSHLSEDKISELASLGEFRKYSSGFPVISEGEKNSDIFFLLKGSVSVYSRESLVCKYGRAGDIFGEMSVVSGSLTSATVITNEETELIIIDGSIIGSLESSDDSEFVTLFYKLFSLSLLEKLRLTTLKARLYEDASSHNPLHFSAESDFYLNQSLEKQLNDTLVASIAMHTSDNPIILSDADGRVIRFNLSAENMFSLIELQVLGKPLKMICADASYENVFPKILKGEINTWTGQMVFLKEGGKKISVRATISRVINNDDELIGTLSILTDISHELELERNSAEQSKLLSIGKLSSEINKEISINLSTVLLNIGILKSKIDNQEIPTASVVNRIERSLKKCLELLP